VGQERNQTINQRNMAVKRGNYTQAEIEYIKHSRTQGKSWHEIAKALKRSSGSAVYQKYVKTTAPESKVIKVENEEVNSISFNIKGVEITMVFK
jgi:hypothetical protein